MNFQVPTDATYNALATLLKVPLDPEGDIRQCAIVSTFSTRKVRDAELQRVRPLRRPRRGGRHRLGHTGA